MLIAVNGDRSLDYRLIKCNSHSISDRAQWFSFLQGRFVWVFVQSKAGHNAGALQVQLQAFHDADCTQPSGRVPFPSSQTEQFPREVILPQCSSLLKIHISTSEIRDESDLLRFGEQTCSCFSLQNEWFCLKGLASGQATAVQNKALSAGTWPVSFQSISWVEINQVAGHSSPQTSKDSHAASGSVSRAACCPPVN